MLFKTKTKRTECKKMNPPTNNELIKNYLKNIEEGITIKKPRKTKSFDINNKSTWTTKCCECGGKMVYIDSEINPRYSCLRCGNTLEV